MPIPIMFLNTIRDSGQVVEMALFLLRTEKLESFVMREDERGMCIKNNAAAVGSQGTCFWKCMFMTSVREVSTCTTSTNSVCINVLF